MIFLKLQQVLYKWNFFRFGQILFNIKGLLIDHLFYNLESGKKKYCFGEKSWTLNPKICTNPELEYYGILGSLLS